MHGPGSAAAERGGPGREVVFGLLPGPFVGDLNAGMSL
jgi:hypothetical protein